MRHRSYFHRLFCLLFCVCLSLGLVSHSLAQEDVKPKEKVTAPRPIKISDADSWERVGGFTLSTDGTWAAHSVMPGKGDGKIYVAQRSGDKKHEFEVGPGSGRIQFSHDSKSVAFIEAPKDKAAKAAKKAKKPLKNKVVIVDLESGDKTEFDNAQSFSFSGENPKCIAIQKMKPAGRPSGDAGWDGSDLIVYDLSAKTQINIGNVKSFSFNKSGEILAMLIDAEGMSGNGLQLFHVAESKIVPLENDRATYRGLSWTREGDALSLLKSKKDKKFENPHHHLIAFSKVDTSGPKKHVLDPTTDPAIPDDMTISPNRSPNWNDDRTAVLFGIHQLKKKEQKGSKGGDDETDKKPNDEKSKKATEDDGEVADLIVWHWQDPRLQSQQQKQESRDKNRFDLCIFLTGESKALRLGDEEIPSVSASRPYKFAIGSDNQKYETLGNLDGRRYRDVYSIDLTTGKRKLILEKARFAFGISPNGVDMLYYDDGHFYTYNLEKGESTNITENVDASFINTEDDHNVVKPPRRSLGWSTKGDYALLSDGWDIWKVAVDGSGGENLTLNGTKEQIRYSNPHRFDPEVEGIDLSKPIYVSAYGEWTKKAGFGRIIPGKPGVEMLVWEDASFGRLAKLKDHDIYMFTRGTHDKASEYFVGGPDLKDSKQQTTSNTHQKNFNWSSGVKLIEYTNEKGDKLQGALHLPADYIEGKKYPTIVYMYEKLSQNANRYDTPRYGGFSASLYTSNGYAVLNPDILFQINDPGLSSKDCILAALQAAVDSGVVDPDNVGLHGHSWGGYQTAFLITQTDKFKAAIAGAPLTNMISMYSSIYWNSGGANMAIFESSQGRFKGGYWDNIEAYTRNSPVYYAENVTTPLILLHNDQDGAVDWNQGIEYYNTLRRLGKPVVMLQYKGENHGLRKPANRKDYSYRMMEFFDHYLKGADAPNWWTDGIKHLDMKDHVKDYKKEKGDK